MLSELTDLLLQEIPEPETRRAGFLDVISQNTKENTINDVYQYFLDPIKSPNLSNLLMDSLLELIELGYAAKGIEKNLELSDYEVSREYNTGKGRIDLVVEGAEKSSVIIIEVKIYHWLANDLKDYWNAFKDYEDENKAAIVLTLEPVKDLASNNANFINITHEQWLNHARNKGIPHNTTLEQIVYFNDFVDNMNHLTKSNMVTEEVLFYLNHAEKIDKAIDTKEAAFNFVIDQLSTVASTFDWTLHGSSKRYRHLWDKDNRATAYYAVLPESILNRKGIVKVKLELYSKAIPFKNEVLKLVQKDISKHGLTLGTDGSQYYQHIAYKEYEISPSDFSNMADIVIAGIEKDLEPVRQKIMVFLEENDVHCNN
ncbi:PD-(D/E)XK nuclease family protein [Bacteroidota bacterium]